MGTFVCVLTSKSSPINSSTPAASYSQSYRFAFIFGRGEVFSKLDLRKAYSQLPLDEESKCYCVISTHYCLYDYTRAPSAPSIWQRVIEQIFQGIEGVVVYFDDLLVSRATQAERDRRMSQVLSQFRKYGVRVGRKKCCCCRCS